MVDIAEHGGREAPPVNYSPEDVEAAVEALRNDLWIVQCVAEAVCPPDRTAFLLPADTDQANRTARQNAVDTAALHRAIEHLTDSVAMVVRVTGR